MTFPVIALDELRRAGSHAFRAASRLRGVPTLVVRGERDTTVPAHTTRALVDRLGEPPELVWLPRSDHLFVLPDRPDHHDAMTAVAAFAARLRGRLRCPARHRRQAAQHPFAAERRSC